MIKSSEWGWGGWAGTWKKPQTSLGTKITRFSFSSLFFSADVRIKTTTIKSSLSDMTAVLFCPSVCFTLDMKPSSACRCDSGELAAGFLFLSCASVRHLPWTRWHEVSHNTTIEKQCKYWSPPISHAAAIAPQFQSRCMLAKLWGSLSFAAIFDLFTRTDMPPLEPLSLSPLIWGSCQETH